MTTEEFQQRLAKQNAPQLIDVRSRLEYQQGHIQGALHIPFWQLGELRKTVREHQGGVLVCCEHGPRAWLAGFLLRATGLQVDYLDGHMNRWKAENRPLTRT